MPRLGNSVRIAIALLVLATAGSAAAASPAVGLSGPDARVVAVRTKHPPHLDGRLDDPAWRDAPPYDQFTDRFPLEGVAPAERTDVRILYDDQNLYVGVRCHDDGPVTSRLARRDDFEIPADWLSVAIDSRLDGKDAFVFQIYPSGVQADALRFNDTDFDPSWDEVWDGRASIDAHGWTAEFLIPLRVLRFDKKPVQEWGIQVRRFVQRTHEVSILSYIPREADAEVSRYGRIVGIEGIRPPRDIELAPFVVARNTFNSNLSAQNPLLRSQPVVSAGMDAKIGLTSNLTLDATVNPDFGEVEADQVVLNLTTFETYYPEKRPFFLEGMDLFALPIQLFYSRRIGRPPEGPPLADGSQVIYQPLVTRILGAAKVSGRLGSHLAIAALDAVTSEEDAIVEAPGQPGLRGAGADQSRVAALAANYGIARLREELPYESSVGATATAVTHLENGPGPQGCPADVTPGPDGHCAHDAYVGSLDATLKSPSADYVLLAQLLGSKLVGGPSYALPDGTTVASGASGVGGTASLRKQGGEHWLGHLDWTGYSPSFEINDAGYNQEANVDNFSGTVKYRTVEPTAHTLSTSTRLQLWQDDDWSGQRLAGGAGLASYVIFPNFWSVYGEADILRDRWDNRETRDGSYFERSSYGGLVFDVENDTRSKLLFNASGSASRGFIEGYEAALNVDLGLRTLPQLELDVSPNAQVTGEVRWADTQLVANGDRQYVFGYQTAQTIGATVRGTYTFTPRLTLQLYTQFFLARIYYDDFSQYTAGPTGHPDVPLSALQPYAYTGNPNGLETAFNVNLVLRWEYELGSEFFLVYTRQQTGLPYEGMGPPSLSPVTLLRGPTADTFLMKLSYFWG